MTRFLIWLGWRGGMMVAMLCLGACSGTSEKADAPKPQPAEESAAAPALTAEQSQQLEKVLEVVRALDASPHDEVAVLAAHGFTPRKWIDTLEDIAADPAMSKAYLAAREP